MNSSLMIPTFDGASRPTSASEGRQLTLAAKALAIPIFLLGLNPFVSWAPEPVNLNVASVAVFAESLHGAGLAKAYRIVEYPEAHGPFEHFDELSALQGMGSATLEKNRSVTRLQYC